MVELKPKGRVLLIDGNNIAWRWFMSHQGKQLSTSNGVVTTTCYGMVESIIKANSTLEEIIFRNTSQMKLAPYDKVIVCWDSARNWRKSVDPEYKVNRNDPKRMQFKEEISSHLVNAKQFFRAIHLPQLEVDGLEADDIIGMAAETYKQSGWTVTIVSGDKDLHQLLDWGRVIVHDGQSAFIDEGEFIEKWGMRANRWQEAKALMGDKGDNVVGIDGIGEVLATSIVKAFQADIGMMAPSDVRELPKISRFSKAKQEMLIAALESGLVRKNLTLVTIPRHHNVLGLDIENGFMSAWAQMQKIQPITPSVFMQVLEMYEMNKHLQSYRTVMACLGLS